ncbi:redox-sensitive transcriptional activator SoxR [Streptomyces sp. NBC_01497]
MSTRPPCPGTRTRRLPGVLRVPQVHVPAVGRLSARGGAAVSALRLNEERVLISSRRACGNQRRDPPDAPRRVAFVRAARPHPAHGGRGRARLTAPGRTPTTQDRARLSRAWRCGPDERTRRLGRLKDHPADCICLPPATCVLSHPDDVIGGRITGSRLLPGR